MAKKLFDFCIGNPPYNNEFGALGNGENKTYASPVYDKFMDAVYEIADRTELITPARFLFNAGSTPKAWNEKMLNDEHMKVLHYEPDSKKVFPNTEIKGGVAISYRDSLRVFGAIKTFTPYHELNTILKKVTSHASFKSITGQMAIQTRFNLEALYKDYPEFKNIIGSDGKDSRFETGIFSKIPLFTEQINLEDDIKALGVIKNKRTWRYFPKRYTDINHFNLYKYKVFIAKSSGSGVFGEKMAPPLVAVPGEGFTRTFISLGAFEKKEQAEAALKYVQSKFLRTMLGVLKITQHNPIETWEYVPLQNFTSSSDIDWTKSVHDIDLQLYRKYKLTKEEIDFIENNVKEMV